MVTSLHKTRVRRGPRPPATSRAAPSPAAKPSSSSRPLAVRIPTGATLRRQKVQCGKARCKKWHGPYWYAFWWADGRTRSAYIGKDARLATFLKERDGGDVVDPVENPPLHGLRTPAKRGRVVRLEPQRASSSPATCVRCGRPAGGPGYCFPSRAWLKKHPKDKGAGAHTTSASASSHVLRFDRRRRR
jgi:hypothetical protein